MIIQNIPVDLILKLDSNSRVCLIFVTFSEYMDIICPNQIFIPSATSARGIRGFLSKLRWISTGSVILFVLPGCQFFVCTYTIDTAGGYCKDWAYLSPRNGSTVKALSQTIQSLKKKNILEKLKNCQNGTFEPVHEI